MDMNEKFKYLVARFGLWMILFLAIDVSILCGLIYFIFWCLKHFNIIGS
jgi:hypothetical protein